MKAVDTVATTAASAFRTVPQIVRLVHAAAGFAVIVACLQGGVLLQRQLNIPVPGNVLGMVLLLILLQMKVVPDTWVRGPSTWLLLLLPACFVPIYVGALSDPAFWHRYGVTLLLTGIIGAIATLSATGWIARRTRRQ